MTTDTGRQLAHGFAETTDGPGETSPAVPALTSNLAALLDRFTTAISHPDSASVGDFAASVQDLHREFAMLAEHFTTKDGAAAGADAVAADDDFDALLVGVDQDAATVAPASRGDFFAPPSAAGEELEHHCWLLSTQS